MVLLNADDRDGREEKKNNDKATIIAITWIC